MILACYPPGLGMFAVTYTYMYLWVYTGEAISKRIRERYLQAVMRQDIAFFDKLGAGEVATRIQTDTHLVQQGISEKVARALIPDLLALRLVILKALGRTSRGDCSCRQLPVCVRDRLHPCLRTVLETRARNQFNLALHDGQSIRRYNDLQIDVCSHTCMRVDHWDLHAKIRRPIPTVSDSRLNLNGIHISKAVLLRHRLSLQCIADGGTLAEEVISTVRTAQAFGTQRILSALYDSHIEVSRDADMKVAIIHGCGLGVFFFVIYSCEVFPDRVAT